MSHDIRKPTKCLGENKGADQLRGNREADQRLYFRYTSSTIPRLLKYKASSHLLRLYILVCVGPGRNPDCWFSHAQAHITFSDKISIIQFLSLTIPSITKAARLENAFNPYLMNGFSHHYQLDASTFILRGVRSDFYFLFNFLNAFKRQ